MRLGDRLGRFAPDISSVLIRFPVPALISFLLLIYANLDVAGSVADGDALGNYVYRAGTAAFLAAMAGHYFAQSRSWSGPGELLLALVTGAVAGALVYTDDLDTSHVYLFAGLIPLAMIAGFFRSGVKQEALWLFSLRMVFGALLATIIGIVFFVCLSDVVSSIDYVFGTELSSGFEGHIRETAKFLVGPLYFLALAPDPFDEEMPRARWLERGFPVLINYVMAPVAIIYAVILHAYAAKAVMDGVLPNGRIGWLATLFLLGPIAVWIVAWPWRVSEGKQWRLYVWGWICLSIVPLILLVLAIWERISAFGLTPDRYGVVAIAVWIAGIALYLAFRRNRADLRVLLGSFALFALVISTGPLGATSLSISSQVSRLIEMLETDRTVTPDGRIVGTIPPMSSERKEAIYNVLDGLDDMNGLDRIEPLFSGRKDNPFASGMVDSTLATNISESLKLHDPAPSAERVNFRARSPVLNDVVVPGRLVGPVTLSPAEEEPKPAASASTADGRLIVRIEGRTWSTPLKPLLERLQAAALTSIMRGRTGPKLVRFSPVQPVLYEIEPGVRLILTDADGTLDDRLLLNSATFWIILQQ